MRYEVASDHLPAGGMSVSGRDAGDAGWQRLTAEGSVASYQDPDKPWRSFHYVRASDGVEIAVAVALPPGYEEGQTYPTMLSMSGYPGATNAGRLPGFVNINISQRG